MWLGTVLRHAQPTWVSWVELAVIVGVVVLAVRRWRSRLRMAQSQRQSMQVELATAQATAQRMESLLLSVMQVNTSQSVVVGAPSAGSSAAGAPAAVWRDSGPEALREVLARVAFGDADSHSADIPLGDGAGGSVVRVPSGGRGRAADEPELTRGAG